MQRWRWKLEGYLVEIFSEEIIKGKKTIEENIVINKLKKSNMPIDEVPWWLETTRVLKEHIVVIALKKIADGVLLLTTKSIFFSSINRLKKYTG